jgi:hypothetical protein
MLFIVGVNHGSELDHEQVEPCPCARESGSSRHFEVLIDDQNAAPRHHLSMTELKVVFINDVHNSSIPNDF